MAKILVIDDSLIARRHLKTQLDSSGHYAIVASGGAEGLAMLAAERPDCVILDQLMPEMEGGQVLRTMREKGFTTPVIMLTADTQITTRQSLKQAGAANVLPKPPVMDDLLKAIGELVPQ